MQTRFRFVLRVALCVVASFRTGNAQQSVPTLRHMHHTAWTLREGAPAEVFALAQTTDGYLWLGTSTGLVRFDGVEFERIGVVGGVSLPSQNISALRALPDGSLWIGLRFGGVGRLFGDRLQIFTESDGLPPNTVYSLARDPSGAMWAGTRAGVYVQRDKKWAALGARDSLPAKSPSVVLIDQQGTLWVTIERIGVFRRAAGAERFSRVHNAEGAAVIGLTETPTGEIWASAERGTVFRLSGATPSAASQFAEKIGDFTGLIRSDHDANLWVGTIGGIGRVSVQPDASLARTVAVIERFSLQDGLSGSLSTAVLVDREGSVWVGTEGGLDRFRPTKLTTVDLPPQFSAPAIVAEENGALLVGNVYQPVVRLAPRAVAVDVAMPEVGAVYRSADGTRWLGNESGKLWHSSGTTFVSDVVPDSITGFPIQAIARETSGALWLSVVNRGVYRRSNGSWSQRNAVAGLPQATALTIIGDSTDAVWLGYTANRLARYDKGTVRVFTASDGINIGNVTAISPSHGHIWIGGESGLMRYERGIFTSVEGRPDVHFRGITGIVERANGDLWLNGAEGITEIDSSQLALSMADSKYNVRFERFDSRDGLAGVAPQLRPLPSVISGRDGDLWFTTSTNAYRVDPDHLRRNTIVPPVHIKALFADGVRYALSDTTALPANTREMQVRYTALSLAVPDRVHFRYQLIGSDTGWHDAGTRRDAFYTNLRPGTYQFRVIASNDDGVWNEAGAAMFVSIPPTFVQSSAFLMLSILSLALFVWYVWRARLRTVSRGIRDRYEMRIAERTRISQELHDTLLQGFTGITLQLQSVKRGIALGDAAAAQVLERILTEADVALREARYAVWDMRPAELESGDVVDALVTFAQSALVGLTTELRWHVAGDRRRLPPDIELAVLRIGREAVANVIKHADATLLTLDFRYAAKAFEVCVADDGCGVAADADSAFSRGHWGISSMKDRATSLGGSVTISQSALGGTAVCAAFVLPHSSNAHSSVS